jgi:PilZ domain-containing protein
VRAKRSGTYLSLPKDLKTSDLTARHDRVPTSSGPAGSRKGKKGGEPFWLVSHSQISLSTSSFRQCICGLGWGRGSVIPLVRDRRSAYRCSLRTSTRVRARRAINSEQKTESEDISKRGIFFATDLSLSARAAVDLVVNMPEEVAGMPSAQWRCTGRVVRVVPSKSPTGAFGVGVEFRWPVCVNGYEAPPPSDS